MTDNDVTLLTSRVETNIAPDDKSRFKDALRLRPQCRLIVLVTVKYLRNIYAPVTEWKMHYTTVTITTNNHALIKCLHPRMGALLTGLTFMIFCKYVV